MSRRLQFLLLAVLVVTLGGAGCGGGEPQPVPLVLDEDACSYCRMAISQREFAAEAVTPGGRVERFDDIGCLLDWRREQEVPEDTAFFVIDFTTGEWLDAADAAYLRSRAMPTPMGSGLAAFATPEAAAGAADRLGVGRERGEAQEGKQLAEVLGWAELSAEEEP